MKRVSAICPGSCGELLQGMIDGVELSVSYPINRYSKVTVAEKEKNDIHKNYDLALSKIYLAAASTLKYLNIPREEIKRIEIKRKSSLPLGKGMSSSTADIGATSLAVATFFGCKLTPNDIARLAASIEPTDGILYKELVLFNALDGQAAAVLGEVPQLKILVLEGRGMVDTITFRSSRSFIPRVDSAYRLLKEAACRRDWLALGKASTISAGLWQQILPKPHLDKIIEIAAQKGAYGVNIAHTGVALGIILDENMEEDELIEPLRQQGILEAYGQFYTVSTTSGGPKIVDEEK